MVVRGLPTRRGDPGIAGRSLLFGAVAVGASVLSHGAAHTAGRRTSPHEWAAPVGRVLQKRGRRASPAARCSAQAGRAFQISRCSRH
jgi:hypothetical protein